MKEIIKKYRNNEELTQAEREKVQNHIASERNHLKSLRTADTQLIVRHRSTSNFTRYAAAASVLLVVGIAFWLLNPSKQPSQYLALTNGYLTEAPSYGSTKLSIEGITIEENETKAKTAYAKGDFNAAATHLKAIIASGKATPEHHYFLALAYLHQNPSNDKAAIEYLLKTRQQSPNYSALEVDWYLALAYIRTNDTQAAKEALHRIDGKYKSKEVKFLLQALPSN